MSSDLDAHAHLIRAGFRCPRCGQAGVAVYGERQREIAGLPVGRMRLAGGLQQTLNFPFDRLIQPD